VKDIRDKSLATAVYASQANDKHLAVKAAEVKKMRRPPSKCAARVALDAATRTGVCLGEPGATPRLLTVSFQRLDTYQIFARAMVWMGRLVREEAAAGRPIGLVVIEGLVPQYDKTLQCGLWAIFTGIAAVKEIPVIVAPIQTWRAFVLGSGKLNKLNAKAPSRLI